jgi:Ca2+-binding RTX toxin-like protein
MNNCLVKHTFKRTVKYTVIGAAAFLVFSAGTAVQTRPLSAQAECVAGMNLNGNQFANMIPGSPNNDLIHGRGGPDTIHGGGCNDHLYGDEGDDKINGGAGFDWCFGGPGNDVFANCEVVVQ